MDALRALPSNTQLQAAGRAVGMPRVQSETRKRAFAHRAGRVVPADRVRINQALEDGSWFKNDAFCWAMRGAKRDGSRLHLLGIVSSTAPMVRWTICCPDGDGAARGCA